MTGRAGLSPRVELPNLQGEVEHRLDTASTEGNLVNKSQLIDVLSAQFDGNRRAARHALESVVDTITREMAKGEKVAITGFGAFEKAIRPARMVRNPATGERTQAEETSVPKFRPGSQLKQVMSGAREVPEVGASTAAKKRAAKSGRKKS
jgi:DNA-binding protein HU-beta